MKTSRNFMRFYTIPIVLFIGILLTGGFTVFYTATARTQTGAIVSSSWPKDFTLAFSQNIVFVDGSPAITNKGRELLEENNLWLQIVDATGIEVIDYAKPGTIPNFYEPYALLHLYQNGDGEHSVFVSTVELAGATYTYIIGFPLSVKKVVMYVDTTRYNFGKILIAAVVVLTAILVITLSIYSYKTFFSSESRRKLDEKAKEEWLANITHDLKTPLAPIRGYAELLSEEENQPIQDIHRYGAIIMKNTLYAEQLVDDLKLTYQLQSNMLPLKTETQNIIRFVREVVIDILNAPEYEKRNISFLAGCEENLYAFDAQLLRRALNNLLINALKHNQSKTEVTLSIACDSGISITIKDDGNGMSAQEQAGLFTRYYRGTSTEVKAEGSGLGMAIAKQIIEAHGGSIVVKSALGAGTTIIILLP